MWNRRKKTEIEAARPAIWALVADMQRSSRLSQWQLMVCETEADISLKDVLN